MVDEIFDRHYQAARSDLNAAISRVVGGIGSTIRDAFEVLVKIEYQSPWATKAKKARCN